MTEYFVTFSGSGLQVGKLSLIREDNSDRGMRYFNHNEIPNILSVVKPIVRTAVKQDILIFNHSFSSLAKKYLLEAGK